MSGETREMNEREYHHLVDFDKPRIPKAKVTTDKSSTSKKKILADSSD
jgi:hypothetical protein